VQHQRNAAMYSNLAARSPAASAVGFAAAWFLLLLSLLGLSNASQSLNSRKLKLAAFA